MSAKAATVVGNHPRDLSEKHMYDEPWQPHFTYDEPALLVRLRDQARRARDAAQFYRAG